MKRENLERLAVIIGTVLTVAGVVALIAACDTGGGLDACEELTGDWMVTFSELESPNPCGTPGPGGLETITLPSSFTVSGDQIKIDLHYDGDVVEFVTAPIDCNGREFTISWEEGPNLISRYPEVDCNHSSSNEINGTFDSADRFSATVTYSNSYTGTACAAEGFPEYCYEMSNWEAVRQ